MSTRFLQANIYAGTNWGTRLEGRPPASMTFNPYMLATYYGDQGAYGYTEYWESPASLFIPDPVNQSYFQSRSWATYQRNTGGKNHFAFRIRGVAKDSGGAPVGNARMMLFRSSDQVFLREVRSEGVGGSYDLGTDDNTTQHFIVGYRAAPDIEGTTVNTLVGS